MKNINFGIINYVILFIITALVFWDLLLPGYILTLDMVFGPQILPKDFPYYITNLPTPDIPLRIIIFILNIFLPVWIIQKILLFTLIFLSGIFSYNLCPSKYKIGKLYAGILYIINPFIFVRFLAGHLDILIGYAFLPLLLKLVIEFPDNNRLKRMMQIAVVLTIISTSYHLLVLSLLLLSIIFITQSFNERNFDFFKNLIKIFLIYILLNAYWIFPLLINTEAKTRTFASWISGQDIGIFTPKGTTNFNVLFNVASLHGFWRNAYDYAKFHINYWYILYFIILFLSIHGFLIIRNNKKLKTFSWIFILTSALLLLFATGVSLPSFSKIFTFFFENIPMFKGFREPHKLLSIAVLMYSFFGGIAVGDFSKGIKFSKFKIKNILSLMLVSIFLLTPLVYSYTMLFGFHDQLDVSYYPKEWESAELIMKADKEDFNVLFLPWHMYMDFNFNPKQRIVNPANTFFSKPLISGDNIEAGGIYSQSSNPVSKYMEFLLSNRDKIQKFGRLVSPINVRYIILAKQVDWGKYDFLFNQTDLELIIENDQLVLFKNKVNTSKIYSVKEIVYVEGEDFFKQIKALDITNTAYLSKGVESNISFSKTEYKKLTFSKISPVEYRIENDVKLVVLTDTFSEYWELDGQKPTRTFMGTNLFVFELNQPKKLYFSRFGYYIIGYLISIIALILAIVMYLKENQKVAKRR